MSNTGTCVLEDISFGRSGRGRVSRRSLSHDEISRSLNPESETPHDDIVNVSETAPVFKVRMDGWQGR